MNDNKILEYYKPFNVNDLPYIKDKTFNELKLQFYELHSTAYDASLEFNYMMLRIDYLLDYIMKNYADLGKKEIRNKLKEIQFYSKKPLGNVLKLSYLIGTNKNERRL